MINVDLRKYSTDKVYQEIVNDCLKGISHTAKDSVLAFRIKEIFERADTAEDALCEIAYESEKYLKEPIGIRCLKKRGN